MTESTPSEDKIASLRAHLDADNRSRAFVDLAQALNAEGQFNEAADVAQRGLLNHPDSVEGRLALAVAEASRDDVKEALDQVKRALLVEPKNADALGLMGQILLDGGLHKRAAHFLAHAAKLQPNNQKVAKMLASARQMMAKTGLHRPDSLDKGRDTAKRELLGLSSLPEESEPWDLDEDQTVFASNAEVLRAASATAKPVTGSSSFAEKLAAVAAVEEEITGNGFEGLTEDGANVSIRFADAPPTIPPPSKESLARSRKVGGSAAELSKLISSDSIVAAAASSQSETKGKPSRSSGASEGSKPIQSPSAVDPKNVPRAPSLSMPLGTSESPKSAIPAGKGPTSSSSARSEERADRILGDIPKAPPKSTQDASDKSKPQGKGQISVAAKPLIEKPGAEVVSAPKAKDQRLKGDELKGASSKKEASSNTPSKLSKKPNLGHDMKAEAVADNKKEAPSPRNAIGPVATRMVDDALFAILGREKEEVAKAAAEASPSEGVQNQKRVVRTSAKLGFWARVAGGFVLCAGAFGVGYVISQAPGAVSPEVIQEEIKGVAAQLERGGAASLASAEVRINELKGTNPGISSILDGALAEVLARKYTRFGRSPKDKQGALNILQSESSGTATLERTYASILLSPSAEALEELDKQLVASLQAYPESPKAWVARAEVARRSGEVNASLAYLTRARAIHPQHRQTLLETARWLTRAGAMASALETYALIQSTYDLDVEVAIERYFLGWVSGEDTAHAEAVSILAGLVRDDIPEVSQDEVGRAALVFAFGHLREGRIEDGLAELTDAESAYADSPIYQGTLGRIFLALGQVEHAANCFLRATAAEPANQTWWMDLARARIAKSNRLQLTSEALERRMAKLSDNSSEDQMKLPYGEVKFRPAEFELAKVWLSKGVFPRGDVLAIQEAAAAELPLDEATEISVAASLGLSAIRIGDMERAGRYLARLEQTTIDIPAISWVNGLYQLEQGELDSARELIESAANESKEPPLRLWLDLARVRTATGEFSGAFDAYQQFFAQGGMSSEAQLGLARTYWKQGDRERALDALKKAEQQEPGGAAAEVLRAEFYLEEDRYKKAQDAITQALRLDSGLESGKPPMGLNDLSAELLMQTGRIVLKTDRKKGVGLLQTASGLTDAPPSAHFFLGKALVASRKTRRSGVKSLQKYLSLEPQGTHAKEAKRLRRRR